MELNTDDRHMAYGEQMAVESLLKRGEQLHSAAIFEMCASLFKGMKPVRPSIFNVQKNMEPGWDNQR